MPRLQPSAHLQHIKAILLDLSGVLHEGKKRLEGAVETVQWLRERNYILRFVTNTATQSSTQIHRKLHDMGFELDSAELFTAPQAARQYLIKHHLKPFLILHPNLLEEFSDLQNDHPDSVLLGDAQDHLNYWNLNRAFQLIEQGAPLIGIGKNKYFMSDDGLQLDSGAFIQALEWASGCSAVIMGKPDQHFFAEVVASTGFAANQCLMVGDDVISDVCGAIAAGIVACQVQTGKFKSDDLKYLPDEAHLIASIQTLPELLAP
ncbi:TIGR01458 family HAD-type hydrolase [Thiomicrorhabdus sp.]|uniref:TIGR01458 family HAD-type hydrolase n=1 Tax=Thiomicrorhabdus sp. TaxID=2039724 RepID=UPI0029C84398|nr:TIGR01458 family HAD-type hydrolase [Thiomicrorhabdus sp.]